ncbi:MAG: TIGR03000 domain-containing protein [Pirellulales bacterium]
MPEGAPADAAPPPPAKEGTTPGQPTAASTLLTVNVPADAKIYVNGKLTSTPGTQRQYISRDLSPGYRYTYRVKAEINQDGKKLTETKTVEIRAGESKAIGFDFGSAIAEENIESDPATRLTVRVPADAKLFLAGRETKSTGELRTFRTARMEDGQTWDNYTVRAIAMRDGREITREKTITLRAGASHELAFDFDAPSIASADGDQAR